MEVQITKVKARAQIPRAATKGSSGVDLRACLTEPLHLTVGTTTPVPTGLAVAVPRGFELQIRPRSGLTIEGVVVANSPGTIDSDYRGEIKVLLYNRGPSPKVIQDGDRIAQLILAESLGISWNNVPSLPESDRGTNGFGSTGLK